MRLRLLTVIAGLGLMSCKNDNEKASNDITKPQLVVADSNSDGIMRVDVEIKDETVKIRIQDQPKNGQLSCDLNGAPLEKCEDGMEIPKPASGNYRLRVRVMEKEKLISIGETRFDAGAASSSPAPIVNENVDPLALDVSNPDFVNGNAIPIDKDLDLKFKFKNTPGCTPVLRCTTDKVGGAFSPHCNSTMGHKIRAERIALGLQYLTAQAVCDQKVGPAMVAYWYGVPADYQPLQLTDTLIGIDQHVFKLVKSNDCPEDLLRFQCAEGTSTEFVVCSGTRRAPKIGFRVRASCNGQIGPVLAIR